MRDGISRNLPRRMRAVPKSLFQPMSSPLRSAKTAALTGGNFCAAWLFVPYGKQSRGQSDMTSALKGEGLAKINLTTARQERF